MNSFYRGKSFDNSHIGPNNIKNNNWSNYNRKFDRQISPDPANYSDRKEIDRRRRQNFQQNFIKSGQLSELVDVSENETEKHDKQFGNPDLPSFKHKQEIQETVRDNRVSILVGETGSGKSTQVPQYLLEDGFKVTVTQPRILASNGVAERIESELVQYGGLTSLDAKKAVGVHTSESNSTDNNTGIKIVTDGLKLAQELGEDNQKSKNEVLIIDEVHEWNTNVEILVATIKEKLSKNPNLRVVLMSATMNPSELSNYFADSVGSIPPVIEMEGRTYPVEKIEDKNSNIVEESLRNIKKDSKQLVFVPGKREIEDTIEKIRERLPKEFKDTAVILPLHSKLSKQEQDKVYFDNKKGPKIIVATNLAQTSITIPDIDVVIDSGLERRKEPNLDDDSFGLEFHAASQNDCDQRAGRTGRTAPGKYILTKLNEETPHTPYIDRPKESKAEILRSDISRNVLRTACYGKDFAKLDLFHSVSQLSIVRSKEFLQDLGALDDSFKPTEIGRNMNKYPLRPSFGRMMTESLQYSEEVRKAVAAITASIEAGGLPNFGYDIGDEWKKLTDEEVDSDMLAQLNIFRHIFNEVKFNDGEATLTQYIADYDLDEKNVRRALNQFEKVCRAAEIDSKSIHSKEILPLDETEREQVEQCIFSGMVGNIYVRRGVEDNEPAYENIEPHNGEIVRRNISGRSVNKSPYKYVVGMPYHFDYFKNHEKKKKNVLEYTTNVKDIGRVVLAMASKYPKKFKGFEWDGHQVLEVHQISTGNTIIEQSSTPVSEYKEEVARILVKEAFNNFNKSEAVNKLISFVNRVNRISDKDPAQEFPRLNINEVREALIKDSINNQSTTDAELESSIYVLLQDEDFLMNVLPRDRVQEIEKASPDTFEFNGEKLELDYKKGQPIVKKYQGNIRGDVYLDDKREIKFEIKSSRKQKKGGKSKSITCSGSRIEKTKNL